MRGRLITLFFLLYTSLYCTCTTITSSFDSPFKGSGGIYDVFADLLEEAKTVLDNNWRGNSTVPSSLLYPHQWSWDSAFISIGLSHFNATRAYQELTTLFNAQWSNGMVPHIVFNPLYWNSTYYFPGPDWWQSYDVPEAPLNINTSGITNPPVHASAILRIFRNVADNSTAIPFLRDMYPKLEMMHKYLYNERDPNSTGLIYVRHPWETGMDNSPVWDSVLNSIVIEPGQIPKYNRTDCTVVNCTDRPSQFDYDRYVYLLVQARNYSYNEAAISAVCPFMLLDTLFNSIWAQANSDLSIIAEILNIDGSYWVQLSQQTSNAINNFLWDPKRGIYADYDLVAGVLRTDVAVVSNIMPLYATIPSDSQADALMTKWINTDHFCAMGATCFAVPSFDRQAANFSTHNYWRGPVWMNINWFLFQGLTQYTQYSAYASFTMKSIINLPSQSGMYEYFDPITGQPYGAGNFSWTAALLIDSLAPQARPRPLNRFG